MVDYLEERLSRLDLLPLDYHLLGDRACVRRPYGERPGYLASCLERPYLVFRDVPVPEALPRRPQERLCLLARLGIGACLHFFFAFEREEILLLRGDELGAVNLQQLLARAHHLVSAVYIEPLYPARDLRGYYADPVLDRLHPADRAYDPLEVQPRGRRCLHPYL